MKKSKKAKTKHKKLTKKQRSDLAKYRIALKDHLEDEFANPKNFPNIPKSLRRYK